MHLWIAVKHAPLALTRDPITHINHYRLDNRWWLPAAFSHRYACHVEIVLTHPCTFTPRASCVVCDALPPKHARDQYDTKHYLTYSVDTKVGCVYRSTGRHVVPPSVLPQNDESWCYFRVPVPPKLMPVAFQFLERQIGKPIRRRFSLNFWCLCRRDGVRLDSDFDDATHWYCSELAAATLILSCPEFERSNIRDPCLISPCALENQLRDMQSILPVDSDLPTIPFFKAVRQSSVQ